MKEDINKLLTLVSSNLKNKEYDQAIKNLEKVLEIDRNHISALSTIADLHVFKKNYSKSIEFFNKVISINPENAFIYNNKGYCLLNLNLFSEAIECFNRAIKLKKDYAEAYNNLGAVYEKIKDITKARDNFEKAIKIKSNFLDAINNLIKIDLAENNLDAALINCEKALSLNNKFNEINNQIGIIYKRKNDYEKSISFFKKALDNNPNFIPSIVNLANIYSEVRDYIAAEKYYKKAYELDPKNQNVLSNYLYLKLQTCNWENLNDLIKEFFLLSEKNNKQITPFVSLLLSDNGNQLKNISIKWSQRKSDIRVDKINKNKNKKIKIGYFSSDFKNHPVISLIKDTFKNHNKLKFELFGFNLSKKNLKENISSDILDNFSNFIDCGILSDKEIREICLNLNIDIIVDLNVHTKDGRPEIFRHRCAPVQINYLGYPGTSGDTCFDYIVGDEIVTPDKYKEFYTEKILQMPKCFFPSSFDNFVYKKKINRSHLKLPEDKFIFCCFNNFIKINPNMLDIWAKILNKCEDSIFLLSAENNSIQSNNILKEFSKRNVSNEKIFFTVKLEYSDYLTRFSLCDLFLDTYPYGGHTTSFEALYANLPVLTLKGNVFQSRVTSSFLNNLGLKDLISNNPLEYINLAQKIYQDKSYLRNLKNSLTENINKTDLFKNKKYTNDLEKIYIDIYNNNVN